MEQTFIEIEGERLEIIGLDGPMPTLSCVWILSLSTVLGGVLVYSQVHGFMADVQSTAER